MQSLESENRRLASERTQYRDELRQAKDELLENQKTLSSNADIIINTLDRFDNLDKDYQRQRQHRETCDRLQDSYQHLLSEYSEKTAELRVEIAVLQKQLNDVLGPRSPVHSIADNIGDGNDDVYSPSRPPRSPSNQSIILDSREASPIMPTDDGSQSSADVGPAPKKARILADESTSPMNEECTVRRDDVPLAVALDDHAGPSVPKDDRPIWQIAYDTVQSFENWLQERRCLYETHDGAEKLKALVEEFLRINGLSANTPDNSLLQFLCHEKALEVFTAFSEK